MNNFKDCRMIAVLANWFSDWCRSKRVRLFFQYIQPTEEDKILDLGSENGNYIASIIPFKKNVYIADINQEMLLQGQRQYGFNTVLLDEGGMLPFEDKFFDIVHCNSVIEHVTIDKRFQWSFQSQVDFTKASFERQKQFAKEIRRIGRNYFVQTPNKYFMVESHTWLPFIQFLPRNILINIIKWFNKYWVKKTAPDWNLLSEEQMRILFPDSTIIKERIFGLTKSLIAVRVERE